jgi:hypothetical protein
VALALPADAGDDDFVRSATVTIRERPPAEPGAGVPQLAAVGTGGCFVPSAFCCSRSGSSEGGGRGDGNPLESKR